MQTLKTTLLALSAAALLGACAGTSAQRPMPATPVVEKLQAYYWDLQAAQDKQQNTTARWQLPQRAPLRLQFSADRLVLLNLCNVANAGYQYRPEGTQVQQPISTMRACAEPGLMELERRVLAQLPQTRQMHYSDSDGSGHNPRLTLEFADGSRWQFAGQATPQTRYGSAPQRVFLEVAAQRKACQHPLIPNASCLQVREIHYADNGVKQSTGAWQPLFENIEGYTHQSGVRNILRLDRYRLKNPPADASSIAYVLDMVVESEQVRP